MTRAFQTIAVRYLISLQSNCAYQRLWREEDSTAGAVGAISRAQTGQATKTTLSNVEFVVCLYLLQVLLLSAYLRIVSLLLLNVVASPVSAAAPPSPTATRVAPSYEQKGFPFLSKEVKENLLQLLGGLC